MKLSELKSHLHQVNVINIFLPNGMPIPAHFHITEIGLVTKQFIDCGGTPREQKYVTFQIWVAEDIEHRLSPTKLLGIIHTASAILGDNDLDILVEYQNETIGQYGLAINGSDFNLTATQTDCLAKDKCGVPSFIEISTSCCQGSDCC